jgi:hypothetical protein
MTHGIGFNQIGHVGLIQHSDTGYFGIVGHTNTTDAVVSSGGYFAGTTGAMTEKKRNKNMF